MKRLLLLLLAAGAMMSVAQTSYAYGYYGHGYYGHGYYHGWYGPRVIIGAPWGPPPPVYYGPPPVVYVTPSPPQTFVEKTPNYAYYCQSPAGYYPHVQRCAQGWMKVVVGDSAPR
ncbi:MAG: hypothetical protein L0G81_09790 [Ewingella sp.]|uniref:hypothetical protein n=1 Tax=Ewingella allii TaxID=3092550 RepID=UPI0026512930|nr:hypothetical protein [Ewingella sp.]